MNRILLVFALPQEYAPLRTVLGPGHRESGGPHKCFHHDWGDREILVLETGMGETAVARAMAWALPAIRPTLVVSSGFAGSLHPDLPVGRVSLAERFFRCDDPSELQQPRTIRLHPSEALDRFCRRHNIPMGWMITVRTPPKKAPFRAAVGTQPAMLDMESHTVVSMALHAGLPVLCFRSISDGAEDEVMFDPTALCNSLGHIDLAKVMASIFRNPSLLRVYFQSWLRAEIAARELTRVLTSFLLLPSILLQRIVDDTRLSIR